MKRRNNNQRKAILKPRHGVARQNGGSDDRCRRKQQIVVKAGASWRRQSDNCERSGDAKRSGENEIRPANFTEADFGGPHEDQRVGEEIGNLHGHQNQREAAYPAQTHGLYLVGGFGGVAKDKAQKNDAPGGVRLERQSGAAQEDGEEAKNLEQAGHGAGQGLTTVKGISPRVM